MISVRVGDWEAGKVSRVEEWAVGCRIIFVASALRLESGDKRMFGCTSSLLTSALSFGNYYDTKANDLDSWVR